MTGLTGETDCELLLSSRSGTSMLRISARLKNQNYSKIIGWWFGYGLWMVGWYMVQGHSWSFFESHARIRKTKNGLTMEAMTKPIKRQIRLFGLLRYDVTLLFYYFFAMVEIA